MLRTGFLLWLLIALHSAAGAVTLRHIYISGNHVTRNSIILRELEVHEGQPINDTTAFLAQSYNRLNNIALFTSVRLSFQTIAPDSVDLNILVKERWYIIPKPIFQLADRNFNVWWDEQHRDLRRINAGLTVTDKNFRGNLESLTATAQAGYVQRLGIDYARPYIDINQHHGIGFSADVAQSGELAYQTDSNKLRFARLPGTHIIRQWDAAITYTYRPRYAIRHLLQLEYHDLSVSDTVLKISPNFLGPNLQDLRLAVLGYRLDVNKVDNWNYPLRGFKMVTYLYIRKGINTSFYQAQLKTETAVFINPAPKWYIASIFRGRLSVPNDVPYFFQQALGTKTDYVRGYEYYVIDGSHYALLRLDLKREIFNKNILELPFRYLPNIPLRLYPKLFADFGWAHNEYPGNSFLHDRLLYSYGLGFDILTAYDVKIRIEAARNGLGQNGLFLHLNSE